MYILGVSSFYHDSAACLIKDGDIIAAAQEERFTRIKHDPSFPNNAIKFCLNEAKISPENIDNIVFYEKPFLKFERLLETYLAFVPSGLQSFIKSMPIWVKEKLFLKSIIVKILKNSLSSKIDWNAKLLFSEHHLSHAASAFYPSPFDSAAILTIDGVGEWTTTSIAIGKNNNIDIKKELHFPHSLGLLYSAFTYYLGFKVNSGEYKVMGLAPYGKPKYADIIFENLIAVQDDGSFHLNMKFFNFATGLKMTNNKFNNLFGGPARLGESKITQKHMDLAASIQLVSEKIVLKIAKYISNVTEEKNLCLSGGVALNCVINGALLKEKIFNNIWIQPAAGDAGGALGAALSAWYINYKNKRIIKNSHDKMKGSFLGPKFDNKCIKSELVKCGAVFDELSQEELINKVVKELIKERAIGWMQGRMEYGPRALGNRSIIADPRSPKMQSQLNLKVKFRESFRPFAPSILFEDLSEWFNLNSESPYMLIVADINEKWRKKISLKENNLFGIDKLKIPRSSVPAITHVDYSARIQTVHKNTNPLYHSLIENFKKNTGCPILINTSFNVRGEPIVCSPTDAFKCFMGTNLDILVIENFIMYKDKQNQKLFKDYKNLYELD